MTEVYRLFVAGGGAGHGMARALVEEMSSFMRAVSYTEARFSCARFLKHASDLYESMGFFEVPPPKDTPPHVYFIKRAP